MRDTRATTDEGSDWAGQSATALAPLQRGPRLGRGTLLAMLAIIIGVALHLPSLRWGFLYDDYIHQFMLRRVDAGAPVQPWNLYNFGTRPGPDDPLHKWGFFPWWTDPDFKIRFFRPVTSLSIALDYRLYGDWAPGYHLTSIILFIILLVLARRLYRRLGMPDGAVLWSTAILALSDIHTLPTGWIANRNSLLAAVFLVAMLLALHSYRNRASVWRLALAVIFFLLGCGAKESGIIGLPLVALHELLYPPGDARGSIKARLRAALRSHCLWAIALTAVVYAACYASAGYGTQSLLYPAPWRSPGQYLTRLAILVPLAGSCLLFGVSADVAAGLPGALPWILVFSAVTLPVALWIIARTIPWTPAALFGVGVVAFSLIPEAGADPSNRLFLNALIGASLLIGTFLRQVGGWRQALSQRRIAQLSLAVILVLRTLVLSVPATCRYGNVVFRMGRDDREAIAAAQIDYSRPEPRHVFVLNSPSSLLSTTLLATWGVVHDDFGTSIHLLQMDRRGVQWHRLDDRRMTLTSRGTPFGDHRFERLFRTGRPVQAGQIHYRTSAFAAIPLEVEPTGTRQVLLEFDRSLDDDAYQFIVWQDRQFVRIPPPRVGETIEIPQVRPPSPLVP